jgi:hypothetical protein
MQNTLIGLLKTTTQDFSKYTLQELLDSFESNKGQFKKTLQEVVEIEPSKYDLEIIRSLAVQLEMLALHCEAVSISLSELTEDE